MAKRKDFFSRPRTSSKSIRNTSVAQNLFTLLNCQNTSFVYFSHLPASSQATVINSTYSINSQPALLKQQSCPSLPHSREQLLQRSLQSLARHTVFTLRLYRHSHNEKIFLRTCRFGFKISCQPRADIYVGCPGSQSLWETGLVYTPVTMFWYSDVRLL